MISKVSRNVSTGKLALAMIVGLALFTFLPTSAKADSNPVDLELGGEGATGWHITSIKPGDSGKSTTTLHNAGYKDGTVTIWISNILNTEGTNPEFETGNITEPGELGKYLVFNISHSRLVANITLPTKIENIPQSASSSSYLKIDHLNAGETMVLDWQWELPPQTGNDVQGDSLSFTINYLLEELPAQDEGSDDSGSPSAQAPPTPIPAPTPTSTPIPSPTPTQVPPPAQSPAPASPATQKPNDNVQTPTDEATSWGIQYVIFYVILALLIVICLVIVFAFWSRRRKDTHRK